MNPGGVAMRAMRIAWLLVAVVLLAPPAFAVDPTEMPTPELQERYKALTHELRCMQCQNQSIADSPVGLAADLRREVRDMLLAGKSDEEIREFMVARYGEFILFRPRMSARNAWLWLAPAVLLAIGAIVAVRIVRQRAKLAPIDGDTFDDDEAESR
jgi:cytochrome c-type biogenesis protein CcmH|nr:MAG: cytochrome c-type biogenesis protein CcmH [Pseudomonadota bacterium]